MTIANQIAFVKRKSRTTSNALTMTSTDDVARQYLNEGARQFCIKTHGIPKEAYLAVEPTFTTRTNWAIRLTIVGGTNALAATDIALTEQTGVDGTTLAAAIESQIRAAIGVGATLTVTWDTTKWTFTIDGIDCTSIAVEAPEGNYVDATENLFGSVGTETATTWVSGFPTDCTIETDLPSDFMEITEVWWGPWRLLPAPLGAFIEPRASGTPNWYFVNEKKIRVVPVPTSQDKFHIFYQGYTTDVTLTGSSDTVECSLPADFHMAPVYFAAAQILEDGFEFDEANRSRALFMDLVNDYSLQKANQNPKLRPARVPFVVPRVKSG